jgi:hypothetical protein
VYANGLWFNSAQPQRHTRGLVCTLSSSIMSQSEPYVIAERSLKYLTERMSSPDPGRCVVDLLGAFSILSWNISGVDYLRNQPGYERQRDTALSIAAHWLSIRRTRAQVNKILTMTCQCSPALAAHKIHRIGAMLLSQPAAGPLLINVCTNELIRMNTPPRKLRHYKLHELASRKVWPHSTQQLLPHGPQSTALGYLDWLAGDEIMSTGKIVLAFASVLQYTWPVAFPAMVKGRVLIDHFVNLAARWKDISNINTFATLVPVGTSCNEFATHVAGMLVRIMVVMQQLCRDCSDPAAIIHFLQDRHEHVLTACNQILTMTAEVNKRVSTTECTEINRHAIYTAKLVGHAIFVVFPGSSKMKAGVILQAMTKTSHNPTHDTRLASWTTLVFGLQYWYIRQQCSAPGCTRTTEQIGRPLRYCVGCLWIPYCSHACQKDAWRRNDGLPEHRNVCQIIRELRLRHQIPHSTRLRELLSNVPMMFVKEEDSPAVNDINSHFAALSQAEIEHKV